MIKTMLGEAPKTVGSQPGQVKHTSRKGGVLGIPGASPAPLIIIMSLEIGLKNSFLAQFREAGVSRLGGAMVRKSTAR